MEIVVKIKEEKTKQKLKRVRQASINITKIITNFLQNFEIEEYLEQNVTI